VHSLISKIEKKNKTKQNKKKTKLKSKESCEEVVDTLLTKW